MAQTDANLEPSQLTWRVFHGEVTSPLARVYVEATIPAADGDSTGTDVAPIEGFVEGPHSHLSSTLPCRSMLRDTGPGATRLSLALLEDPCCWTPDLPVWYSVHAWTADRPQERHIVNVGLRSLGHREQNLIWHARRYVFRVVDPPSSPPPEEQFLQWRETGTSIRLTAPNDTWLSLASRWGVPVVLDFTQPERDILWRDCQAEIASVIQYPAVSLVLIPPAIRPSRVKQLAPNVLVAQWLGENAESSIAASHDAPDVWIWSASDPVELSQLLPHLSQPVIACRFREPSTPPAELRADCDALQRDLAPHTNLAGYASWHRL